MNSKALVFIVDDEKDLVEILQGEVEFLGYDSLTANNGQEALDKVLKLHKENKWIDAIISDINMPQKNGLEFLRELRAAGVQTPFIFFSAYGDKEKTLEALRLGAMDFVEKPFAAEVLIKAIKKAVELGQSMRAIEVELDNLIKNLQIPEAEIEKFKQTQREILKLKKNS